MSGGKRESGRRKGRGPQADSRAPDTADDWARQLGLAAELEPPEGWRPKAGQRLMCSREAKLDERLSTIYRRRAGDMQPDLFLDGSDAVALTDLRAALSTRDPDATGRCLGELLRRMPEHRRRRPAAERLCDALSNLGEAAAPLDPALELGRLQGELAVDARELLGPGARDFEVPFWRRLAGALEGRHVGAREPDLHASYAFSRFLAWHDVIECVLAAPAAAESASRAARGVSAAIRIAPRRHARPRRPPA